MRNNEEQDTSKNTAKASAEETGVSSASKPQLRLRDPIETAVQDIWVETPGMGIRELYVQVNERLKNDTSDSTSNTEDYSTAFRKMKIRVAKAALPYRRITAASSSSSSNNTNLDDCFDKADNLYELKNDLMKPIAFRRGYWPWALCWTTF
jgi:hypothetical protein